ncbi:MAG: SH3 domain-containing protein [Oscillospiraceae bacterium]|nr:SH3 domain-containing protein [Oscillospiraceae bacterium]
MEGTRTAPRRKRHNPLYLLFLGLCAAVAVLLILSIVLGIKVATTSKAVTRAEAALEEAELQLADANKKIAELEEEIRLGSVEATDPLPDTQPENDPTPPTQQIVPANSWIDFTKHPELLVYPASLFDSYKTYYVNANKLNVRSGPGTSYDVVDQAIIGESVSVAAEQDGWMLVKYNKKLGWTSATYLSTTKPVIQTVATSGNIR